MASSADSENATHKRAPDCEVGVVRLRPVHAYSESHEGRASVHTWDGGTVRPEPKKIKAPPLRDWRQSHGELQCSCHERTGPPHPVDQKQCAYAKAEHITDGVEPFEKVWALGECLLAKRILRLAKEASDKTQGSTEGTHGNIQED